MAHISSWGGDWLVTLANRFWDLSDTFYRLYLTVYDVLLLGKYLAEPFYQVCVFFNALGNAMISFVGAWEQVVSAVNQAVSYWDLDSVISGLFGQWYALRSNPVGWVRDRLSDTLADAWFFFYQPGTWVLERIRSYSPQMYAWLVDFPGTFRSWLASSYTWAYLIFYDPTALLLGLAYQLSYDAYRLLADPSSFIQEKLASVMLWPTGFWADPAGFIWEWLAAHVEAHIQVWTQRFYRLSERILRYWWEGVF